jgi:hypothetical protein
LILHGKFGRTIIRKIYEVLNQTYDEDKCTTINPERNSLNVTGNQTILGKTVKKKRWRPTANVRFTHAVALIHGLSKPVVLVDRTGRYLDVLAEPS